jgi:hypothetical protein
MGNATRRETRATASPRPVKSALRLKSWALHAFSREPKEKPAAAQKRIHLLSNRDFLGRVPDRSFISDVENGKKEICIRNLQLLATTFGMSISKLLSRL